MIGLMGRKGKRRTIDLLLICQNPGLHRGLFHKPQVEMVPAAVGELDFERPIRGRGNRIPPMVVRGARLGDQLIQS